MNFQQLCEKLEQNIKDSYENGVSMLQAERLAGEFLHGMLLVSQELKSLDLSSRMNKAGLKAIKAAVYLEAASKGDKKPTEAALAAMVDASSDVREIQSDLDESEVERDSLERYYNTFREAHLHFRAINRGGFGT